MRYDGSALAPRAVSAQALLLVLRRRQFRSPVAGKSLVLPRSGAGRPGEVLAACTNVVQGACHKASPSPGALGVLPSGSGDAAWWE